MFLLHTYSLLPQGTYMMMRCSLKQREEHRDRCLLPLPKPPPAEGTVLPPVEGCRLACVSGHMLE